MDPNETAAEIIIRVINETAAEIIIRVIAACISEHLSVGHATEAMYSAEILRNWLRKDGFKPDVDKVLEKVKAYLQSQHVEFPR